MYRALSAGAFSSFHEYLGRCPRLGLNSAFGAKTNPEAMLKSFQEEIHAIEIDDGVTDVQRVHPQNATDSRAALPQREMR